MLNFLANSVSQQGYCGALKEYIAGFPTGLLNRVIVGFLKGSLLGSHLSSQQGFSKGCHGGF